MNAALFASTVLIWGTTWIAIAAEIGPVPVLVSVFYRFALAAAMLLVGLALARRLTVPAARHHPFILAQALCLYCFNFICFYAATAHMPSGLVSVVFSLASLFNVVNARLFFGAPIAGRAVLAGALGAGGVALLFAREAAAGLDGGALRGLGLAALGTLFFSLGNMASRRNSAAGVAPVIANAWGMGYGALALLALIALTGTPLALLALIALTGTPLAPPPDGRYAAALLYLSAVGSVVGFTAYLSLVARVGSARAAYATVLFPVVALAISTAFEGYRWHWTGVLGLAVALGGNVLAFSGPAAGVRAATPPPAAPAPPERGPGRPPARAPR